MNDLNKVLIIEDNDEVVEAVSLALSIRWSRVEVASTGSGVKGAELAVGESHDLVVLDIGLPDISGFEVLRRIRASCTVPIIILTVRGEEADIVRGLELGADEYIVKPFRQLELTSRIKAVIRKKYKVEGDSPIIFEPFRFYPSENFANFDGIRISLTCTESIILKQLMKNVGMVVTHARLAEELWGDDYPGSASSLKVHIRRLRQKIELEPSHPKLIITKHGLGYLFEKPS